MRRMGTLSDTQGLPHRAVWMAAIVGSCAGTAFAQVDALPRDIEPRVATLDCGATVVMIEDHRRPMFSAQLWFRHARDAEPPDAE